VRHKCTLREFEGGDWEDKNAHWGSKAGGGGKEKSKMGVRASKGAAFRAWHSILLEQKPHGEGRACKAATKVLYWMEREQRKRAEAWGHQGDSTTNARLRKCENPLSRVPGAKDNKLERGSKLNEGRTIETIIITTINELEVTANGPANKGSE